MGGVGGCLLQGRRYPGGLTTGNAVEKDRHSWRRRLICSHCRRSSRGVDQILVDIEYSGRLLEGGGRPLHDRIVRPG